MLLVPSCQIIALPSAPPDTNTREFLATKRDKIADLG